jgi:predicted GNAT family acetyltransferase
MNTNSITVSHDVSSHQFATVVDGYRAKLDYTLAGGMMNITHTNVPPQIGGRGIAAELMGAALNFAREQNLEVNPLCSYAAAYLNKHPEVAEKRHLEDLLDEGLDESFPASDPPSVGGAG